MQHREVVGRAVQHREVVGRAMQYQERGRLIPGVDHQPRQTTQGIRLISSSSSAPNLKCNE